MFDKLCEEINSVLDAYMAKVGCGFFTRNSRMVLVRNLRLAMQSKNQQEVISLLLHFAMSMQGPNADKGGLNRSRLHNALWGSSMTNRHDGVYQQLYDFVLSKDGNQFHGMKLLQNGKEIQLNLNNHKQLSNLIGYNWAGKHSLIKRNVLGAEFKCR